MPLLLVFLLLIAALWLTVRVRPRMMWKVYTDEGMRALRDGRLGDADGMLQTALAAAESLAILDPRVAASAWNMARLREAEERWPEAERFYQKALAILEIRLGMDHPEVGRLLESYVEVLRRMRRESEVAALAARARRIRDG